jgi:phenylacetate-coenzyme A ligase PaaK-like adenylate-forming protein
MTEERQSALEELRARSAVGLAAQLDEHVQRLSWDGEQVRAHQRRQLRALLSHAVANSRFHSRRLGGIDPHRFELSDLPTLPTMTKPEMMANFDQLITDHRLTRRLADEHLASSRVEPSLLFDQYVCLASGGSSGLRGVFVQRLDELIQFVATVLRGPLTRIYAQGGPPPEGVVVGMVAAASPVHSSGFGAATATRFPVRFASAPATLPLAEIVARLNAADPPVLQGYPSLLRQLAHQRRAGQLEIAPRSVTSLGETLTHEDRDAITTGFGVPVSDLFVSTEGLVGRSEPGSEVLTFASDNCIVELVDHDGNPVKDGVPSAKALVTNLHNFTQPLIRYELTDQFTAQPSDPENGHLRATVDGRADTIFRYGSIELIPFAIRSALATTSAICEYQIRQTDRGLEVAIVPDGGLDVHTIAARLKDALRAAGLADPEVTVRSVDAIERHVETGKTRRFIPLSA